MLLTTNKNEQIFHFIRDDATVAEFIENRGQVPCIYEIYDCHDKNLYYFTEVMMMQMTKKEPKDIGWSRVIQIP